MHCRGSNVDSVVPERRTRRPARFSGRGDRASVGRAHSRASPSGAFTLLEVILALGIMSVVAVALFTSLHVAFKSKRVAEATLEPVRAGETVMELVRGDLELALPPRGVLAGPFVGRDWRAGSGGDDDDVTFFTMADAPPGALTFGDIKRVQLAVVTLQGTGERVLARRVLGNLLSPVVVDPDDEILCRGVASFNLRYYDGTQWWTTWDSTTENDSLPVAVEVTIELEPAARRANDPDARWPRLTRVVQIPCTGEADPSERRETGTGEGTGEGGAGPAGPQARAAGPGSRFPGDDQ